MRRAPPPRAPPPNAIHGLMPGLSCAGCGCVAMDRIVGRHVDDVRPRRLDQDVPVRRRADFLVLVRFRLPTSWAARR